MIINFLILVFFGVSFIIKGYLESIFERKEIELSGLRDYDKILPWLLQDSKGDLVRKQTIGMRDLAKNLAEPFEIEDKAITETEIPGLEVLKKQAKGLSSDMKRNETIEIVDNRIREVISEKIDIAKEIEELEEVETKNIKGLKEEKTRKLKQLESRERAEARERLITEVQTSRNVSETEAEKIVTREKLVTVELGEPRYLF